MAIAREGLQRLVDADREPAASLELLAPIERRLAAGRTAADDLLDAWRGEWGQDRAKLVDALRFQPESTPKP